MDRRTYCYDHRRLRDIKTGPLRSWRHLHHSECQDGGSCGSNRLRNHTGFLGGICAVTRRAPSAEAVDYFKRHQVDARLVRRKEERRGRRSMFRPMVEVKESEFHPSFGILMLTHIVIWKYRADIEQEVGKARRSFRASIGTSRAWSLSVGSTC